MEEKIERVILAEDDEQMQIAIAACLKRSGFDVHVVADGQSALNAIEESSFDLIISDQRMPELTGQELLQILKSRENTVPFIMITAHGTIMQAVEAMQQGAADFITKPFSSDELLRVVQRVLSPESKEFRSLSKNRKKGKPIISNNPLMVRILEISEAVAKSDATVLVQGESGTGKELIARLIHSASQRENQAFVAVNCAALPSNLLESELFGHEKGSFTGALQRKIGKFELAHGGTILLDEISEMELPLQAKLLRILQEREVDRVGGKDPISIDVRVVATTNRNLEEEVKAGRFRADLYYRLNVIPITIPALRERKGDIKLLIKHFMGRYLGKDAPKLSDEVLSALEEYPWPGNVRELQNAVERAAILSQGRIPSSNDFLLMPGHSIQRPIENSSSLAESVEVCSGENIDDARDITNSDNRKIIRSGVTVAEMEKELILETLKSTSNNRTKAAELLGISIRTLRNKLNDYKKLGLISGEI